jgi:hypothetical protein
MPQNREASAAPSGTGSSDQHSTGPHSSGRRPAYDAVTFYFVCEEEPFRVEQVRALRKSHFPISGGEAVQVIEASWASAPDRDLGEAGRVLKARTEGLFETYLILIRPEKVDSLILERGEERWEVSLEEALG